MYCRLYHDLSIVYTPPYAAKKIPTPYDTTPFKQLPTLTRLTSPIGPERLPHVLCNLKYATFVIYHIAICAQLQLIYELNPLKLL